MKVIKVASDRPTLVDKDAVEKLGLRDSYKISLSDTVRVGFMYANTLLLGDTGHDHYREITGALGSQDVQVAIAESAGTHIFLELPKYRQKLVDQFQSKVENPDESPNVKEFAYRFEHEDDYENNIDRWTFNPKEATQDYLQNYLSPLLHRSAILGVHVHLLDQGNGFLEKSKVVDLNNRFLDIIDELKHVRTKQDVEKPSVKNRLDKLNRRYQELLDDTYAARQKFYEARHDDKNLVDIANLEADGGKSIVLFGGAHGSRHNDFEEHFKGGALKIDIAISRKDYEGDYARELARLRKFDPRYGEDPADLVYFLDEGVLATTVNTSPEVVKLIESVAQPLDILSSVQEQAFDSSQPATSTGVKP